MLAGTAAKTVHVQLSEEVAARGEAGIAAVQNIALLCGASGAGIATRPDALTGSGRCVLRLNNGHRLSRPAHP